MTTIYFYSFIITFLNISNASAFVTQSFAVGPAANKPCLNSQKDSSLLLTQNINQILIGENQIQDPIGLTPEQNVAIFIIGLIPFLWATYEFWSRIAVGSSFGTGKDAVIIRPSNSPTTIGKDGDKLKSRGRRILGDDALIVAYALFAIAIASVGIAIYSVSSSPIPSIHQ
jgi:hypothetical protein